MTPVCVCASLTQCGVVKGELSQVSGVLRQGEQPPGVAVPHQGAPGAVLQHAVLDDLHTEAGRNTRYTDDDVLFVWNKLAHNRQKMLEKTSLKV